MAQIKTSNFLPEVFRTDANKKFLNATLDQLVTQPDLRNVNGYVGRKFAPTFKSTDNYQPEPTTLRQNYQLEPSVVVKNKTTGATEFFSSYIDLLQEIDHNGGIINNQSRLFANESYSFDGLFDFDKFVNFNQYYWLTDGPESVSVYGSSVPTTETFTVSRNPSTGTYMFSTSGSVENPTVKLARGGVYKFIVNQPGYPFWIQTDGGVGGTKPNQTNISSRDVLGVTNNGTDVGTVTFSVPQSAAQDFYVRLPLAGSADLSTQLYYNQIHGKTLSSIVAAGENGFDGVNAPNQLNLKILIFVGTAIDDSYWTVDNNTVPLANRLNAWRIILSNDPDPIVTLDPLNQAFVIGALQKVFVKSGISRAEYTYYLDNDYLRLNIYKSMPAITAPLNTLYYQDGIESSYVGQLGIVALDNTTFDVDFDIIGKKTYQSPNGVVFTNGLKITFDSSVTPSTYANNSYYVEGVGTSIQLLPVADFITPEPYAANGIDTLDYITINRGSQDLNPWTRSNRWFHIDVINATAAYNNNTILLDQNLRANRPIIEFDANLQLYNFGRRAKVPVDLFSNDGTITDALSQVELQARGFTINGVVVTDGMRIVFADDIDPRVKNQIYIANIVHIPSLTNYVINLVASDDYLVETHNNIVVTQGTNKGIEYYFDGTNWIQGQQKTSVNQTPMFDVVDSYGYSLGTYTNSTFPTNKNNLGTIVGGTKIFSYQVGTGANDGVLGFPLSYRSFNQIGDIQFDNNFDADTITYVDGNGATQQNININTLGTLQQNSSLIEYVKRNNWTTNVENSKQFQVISGTYDGMNSYFKVDITKNTELTVPYFRVYRNSQLITGYELVTIGVVQYVHITDTNLATNDRIDILTYSDQVSASEYYEVPKNLDYNSENANFSSLTLGQLRNHLLTMVGNSNQIVGTVPGDSNLRDIPVKAQGGSILQHSSPVLYSELFLIDQNTNFIRALDLARHEYNKFKNKIIELSTRSGNLDFTNIPALLDTLLKTINSVKNNSFAWYYSDMVPYGDAKNIITYTVLNAEIIDYEISNIFSDTTLSNKAVLVYLNNVQLIKGVDYVFDTNRSGITFITSLTDGDVITINEYNNTDGNYIPETPSKLGLYPKFRPSKYYDTTYSTPIYAIQGHDGSVTPAFGDYRDDLLLEFEKRIYNNIKVDYQKNVFDIYNYLPGKFRTTDYTNTEFTQLLSNGFLQWTGANRVDYITNSYFVSGDPFSWNYNKFQDSIDGEKLLGNWRGIYRYFYDTDRPHTNPWEMLGFTEQPTWWETRYGPAPYTGGNLILWEDLAAGYIYGENRYDTRFVRDGLLNIIPVNDKGELRSPEQFAVKSFNSNQASGDYRIGDCGPVESAWRRSSDYPYAMQRALALSHPAFYFGSLLDIGRYYKNTDLGQYVLSDTLQRVTPGAIKINGTTHNSTTILRGASYLNWIAEYLRNQGIDPSVKLYRYLDNVNIQLAYKMAGYTDQTFIQVIAEQSSPTSTNAGVVIPPESYEIDLYKSTPIKTITYSAVVIEKSEGGYTVSGFDFDTPYFTIIPSLANNSSYPITVLKDTAIVYNDYQNYKITVPYGFEFTNKQQVVDFLVSYQRFLRGSGIQFTDQDPDLGVQRDFLLSIREFLTWAQQGWKTSSVLVLSPVLDKLTLVTTTGVVDQIQNQYGQSRVLDTNYNFVKYNSLSVSRESLVNGNTFSVTALNAQTMALVKLNVVEYEHVMIFDNKTIFNDVIYVPELGNRQYRLKLVGKKTGSWTGGLNPAGFVYNSNVVDSWQPGTDYALGTLVRYKNNNYTATQDIIGAGTFNPNYWAQLTTSELKTGLLPNFSYNAEKFNRFNDIDNPELLGDFHLYSDSAIGFQPRDYLTNFGINTVTQSKFYQGFIREKGTMNAVNAYTAAGFNGITSTVNLYEEWAMRVGEYGATNSNQYVELILSEGTFNSDPVTFTLINDNITTLYLGANASVIAGNIITQPNSKASGTVLSTTNSNVIDLVDVVGTFVSNIGNVFVNSGYIGNTYIYNNGVNLSVNVSTITSSTKSSGLTVETHKLYDMSLGYTPEIYTNRDASSRYENDIQTAGYVRTTDVSTTIFNIGNYNQLTANLATVGIGYTIWCAKDTSSAWNVYRVTETNTSVLQVSYSVDNIGTVATSNPHGFAYGDIVVIKGFDTRVDGFYQVYAVVNSYTFSIVFSEPAATQVKSAVTITGTGVLFHLQSSRISGPTDLNAITPAHGWMNNDKLWIDSDEGSGSWAVYNKSTPWSGNVSYLDGNLKLATEEQTLLLNTTANSQTLTLSINANITAGNTITQLSTGALRKVLANVVNSNKVTVGYINSYAFNTTGNTYIYAGTANLAANLSSVATNTIAIDSNIAQLSSGAWGSVTRVSGNTIVIKSNISSNAFVTSGNTFIYNNGANLYASITSVQQTSYTSGAGFGTVTAINAEGTFAAAGMPTLGIGNVAVFVANISNHNTLTQVANLGALVGSVSNFGASLDTAGNLLYIGNPGDGATEYGRVHVYQFDGSTTFSLLQTISSNWGSNTGDKFGYSISVSADSSWLFVGAPFKGNVEVYANVGGVYTYANTIVGSATANLGHTVKTTSDASQTVISAPYQTVNSKTAAGAVYIYDRSVERFIANGVTYLTKYPITATTLKVTVNGNIVTSGFTSNANAVVFSSAPVIGSVIDIDTNKIQLLEQIISPTPGSGGQFGIVTSISGNDADVYVASPGHSAAGYHSGIVYRFVNQGASYGTITSNTSATGFTGNVTAGDSIRINGIDVVMTGANIATANADINAANISGITSVAQDFGALTITSDVTTPYQRLVITPGNGNVIANLGLEVYSSVQSLMHPATDEVTLFGSQVVSSADSRTLVVTATSGSGAQNSTTFDTYQTYFDSQSTEFIDSIGSGMVYIYGLVNGALSSTARDQYTLVQRLENRSLSLNDQFGYSVAMNANTMLVGAPGDSKSLTIDPNSGAYVPIPSAGTYYTYHNFSGNVGWDIVSSQQPKIDIDSVGSFYLYNSNSKVISTRLDYIDPAKGKILGVAQQDLDYITAYDPAVYNAVGGIDGTPNLANSQDFYWGAEQVTQVWWDIDSIRYIDYEQGDSVYRANNWGRQFPGSTVRVCEWVESDMPPGAYTGLGTPLYPDNSAYCVVSTVNPDTKLFVSKYYFWVTGKTSLETSSLHKNTISTIADIIQNPQSQDIPYAAVLSSNAISLYGISNYLSGNSTVFHADYAIQKNNNIIHSEYELVGEGDNNSDIPLLIINKVIDSLSGIDANGNPVTPLDAIGNYVLPVQRRIGIGKNQTLIIDRLEALRNLVEYINRIFIQFPIVAESNISSLYAGEPLPNIIDYDLQVDTYVELSYIDKTTISSGYVVLVIADETQQNLWTTYTWNGTTWKLTYTQSYNTSFYWDKVDWYESTYDSTVLPTYTVNTFADIASIVSKEGDTFKVLNNGNGEFAIYRVNSLGTTDLVGIENGTIQINSSLYSTEDAKIETRIILSNYTIFVTNFDVSLNDFLFIIINYILSEQPSVDWIFKTSFVTVLHKLRKLNQPANYTPDNQTYYESYINEVKPYRTSIREYKIDYEGDDSYSGDMTDFDVPATHISSINTYRSPDGSLSSDSTSLSTLPQYNQWYNNYEYGIIDVTVANNGGVLTTTLTLDTVVSLSPGDVITQPIVNQNNFGAIGTVKSYTANTLVELVDVDGTFITTYNNLVADVDVISAKFGDVITQPSTGATGNILAISVGNITLSNVVGTFTATGNTYIYNNGANLQANITTVNSYLGYIYSNGSNLSVRPTTVSAPLLKGSYYKTPTVTVIGGGGTGANVVAVVDFTSNTISGFEVVEPGRGYSSTPEISINGTGTGLIGYAKLKNRYLIESLPTTAVKANASVTVYSGNIITQPNTGAYGTVYSASTGNVITLIDVVGTFANYQYLYSDLANLGVTTSNSVTSYTQFVDQSYNTTRNITTTLKFDRTSYTSNIATWQPNVTVSANSYVRYDGQAYQATSNVYSTAILTMNSNVTTSVGNYITQANATGNSRVLAISSNLQLITLGNITGTYQRRGGNILVNGVSTGARPININNVFDYTKYTLLNSNVFTSASDRITAYYQPGENMPGLDLSQLMTGISYPGVTIAGVKFDANSQVTNSNIVYSYSNVGKLFSSNISVLNFTDLGYAIGLPLVLVNNDTSTTYKLTIADISASTLVASGITSKFNVGANITLKYYDYDNPTYLDTTLQNTYTNTTFGSNVGDVTVDGGAYIDTYSSHAPEELIPGTLYDSLNMLVTTKIENDNAIMSYRIVHNMGANASSTNTTLWPVYYGVDDAHTTTLSANLTITDGNIHVTDASKLVAPNPSQGYPGVVYINGEKIVFWSIDLVNNTLGQIRRAVDGTGAPDVHVAGSSVVETSTSELIPGGNIVHTTHWLNLADTAVSGTIIADNYGVSIADNIGNILVTAALGVGAVTDGLGLENSLTEQAVFIKNLKINI
jgi:hypothetical protein